MLHHDRALTGVGAESQEVAIGAAFLGLGEFVADAVPETKGVVDLMPVRARQFARDAFGIHPFAERVLGLVGDAKRPEMDVLDVADVEARVHIDAALDRITGQVANPVPRRRH